MHRLFVALRPPPDIRDALVDAMDELPGARWQDEEQLHITLRFVGGRAASGGGYRRRVGDGVGAGDRGAGRRRRHV